ncbi:MAG TPA: VWA domain-containing protein [Pyrinomonadaceae bacterium]|nr:VWA domain-containing protein [Pyrinomonadaceae bacterium]
MMRSQLTLALLVCLLLTCTAENAAQTRARRVNAADEPAVQLDGEVLRVDTTLVVLPVSVRDRDGRTVHDLTKEHFKIFEEGVEQEIAYFAPVDEPFTVVLMLDTSSSVWKKLDKIKEAAARFVDHLRPADRVMVISFAHKTTIHCEPTDDRERLLKTIQGIGKGMSTHLYDAVKNVMTKQLRDIKGRKAVVLFTDGVDESGDKTAEETLHYAEELDALIYTVRFDTYDERLDAIMQAHELAGLFKRLPLPGSSGGRSDALSEAYERGRRYLRDLAVVTGGHYFEANRNLSDLDQAFNGITEELRRQYSIGYYPHPLGRPGERRRVRVRVERSNVAVNSRSSYVLQSQSQARVRTSSRRSPRTKSAVQ